MSRILRDEILLEALQLNDAARSECLHAIDEGARKDEDANGDSISKNYTDKALAILTQLRAHNRKTMLTSRALKLESSEEKSKIDALLLEVQNFHYEQCHLEKEIKHCENFHHVYRSIPLVSESEFFESTGISSDDVDEVMKARLRHEQEVRVKLDEHRKTLAAKRSTILQEAEKAKEELEDLTHKLDSFINAAEPIEQLFATSVNTPAAIL